MKKIISFMHVSLDGYVAGPGKEMNWIKVDEEIFDFVAERIGATNTALYGRNTYQMMESYWPGAGDRPNASKHDREHSKWYLNANKIVLSTTLQQGGPKSTIISDSIAERLHALQQVSTNDSNEILLFGSPTATHALMEQNLIDGYWLFVNPIILGKGIPLFKNIQQQTALQLLSTRRFKNGVTELNYTVER